MKMLDLFSGIGGFALAARWTWKEDLDVVGFCEIEEYCQKVLEKNFPNVPIYEDINELDGNLFNDVDLITGGFPCQDISQAGRGAGIEKETRSGLWFEMLRVISEVRPRYAIIENVPMLTIRGGTRVIEGLAEIGYDAEWVIIGANDVGAWHTRKRIWIVAYPSSERHGGRNSKERSISKRLVLESKQERTKVGSQVKGRSKSHGEGKLSDTNEVGRVRRSTKKQTENTKVKALSKSQSSSNDTQRFVSEWNGEQEYYWAFEPSVGRVADGIPDWVDRIKGLGNAIVPQIAKLIMDRIKVLL